MTRFYKLNNENYIHGETTPWEPVDSSLIRNSYHVESELTHNQIHKFHIQDGLTTILVFWMAENLQTPIYWDAIWGNILIKDEAEAVFFKLRWCDNRSIIYYDT